MRRRQFPTIKESAAELKQRMQGSTKAIEKSRLHLLYLIVSEQVMNRTQAATVLGVHYNTVGRWLQKYEAGGLAGLLEVKVPPGATPQLNPSQQAALRAKLAEPAGFTSYRQVQAWVQEQFGIQMNYATLYHLVRYRMGAKLKVARPTHPKKK